MAAPRVRTRHPGIYKRGSRYVVRFRVNGRERSESARTLDEALRLKRAREADRDRGEFQEQSRVRFREYAKEWIDRYQGNGRRGFTENTREDYRRDLERYAYPYLDERLGRTVSSISPRDLANWIGWLCEQPAPGGGKLADSTVRRIVSPVRACMATARREGLIRHNPVDGAVLPHRERVEEADEEHARALTRAQLGAFLRVVHPDWRLLFRFLAATGLRWSELAALQWGDLTLDGSEPRVRVRRALVPRKGRSDGEPAWRIKPPKSRYGRRTIPLDTGLVFELRRRRSAVDPRLAGGDALVFAAVNGEPLRQENVRRRVLQPAAEEAGVAWAGFHTFRHTCASILFERGRNAKQVQQWLGHHAASFTLDTYTHLLDGGLGEGISLDAELARRPQAIQAGDPPSKIVPPNRQPA